MLFTFCMAGLFDNIVIYIDVNGKNEKYRLEFILGDFGFKGFASGVKGCKQRCKNTEKNKIKKMKKVVDKVIL